MEVDKTSMIVFVGEKNLRFVPKNGENLLLFRRKNE